MPILGKKHFATCATAMLLIVCRHARASALFSEDFEKPLGERWKQVKFDDLTDYHVVTEGSNKCLRGFANGAASAFATKLNLKPAPHMTFSWRWKIDTCPKGGSDDKAATFDHTARVLWRSTRSSARHSRSITCGRIRRKLTRCSIIQAGRARNLSWWKQATRTPGNGIPEHRDLRKDWDALFKGEPMPKIVGIGVFTDSDGTHVPVTGSYDDITLEEEK
jgi:hypothetical protein